VAIAELERTRPLAELDDVEAGQFVTRYAEMVVAGEIVTGRLVRLAAERHLRDLVDGPARGLRFDPEVAGRGIRFFPMVLRHYKGEWGPILGVRREGLPIELELWECFIVGSILGWLRITEQDDWVRRFRKAFVELAKKNGKTLLFAGLGIKLGFFDDEPSAEVYSAATKKDQAKLPWNDAAEMVRRSPALARRIRVPPRDRPNSVSVMLDLTTASRFLPLSSEASGEDGINPHAILIDELHRVRDRGLVDLLQESTGARRQPLVGEITTAGEPGPSLWREEHDYAERVLEDVIQDDGLFAYVANLDPDDDWRDEAVWPKANPNLGVSVSRDDLRRAVQEAIEKPGKKPAVLRLRFNIVTNSAAKAIDLDRWKLCSTKPHIAAAGAEAWGGLDLGWSRDLSSFALWIPNDDGTFDLRVRFWCPEESAGMRQAQDRIPYRVWGDQGHMTLTEGNVRDDDAVLEGIVEECAPFNVRRIRFDRAMSTNLVNRLVARGFELEPQSQTVVGLGPAWKEFDKLYLAAWIRTGGQPVLDWMAGNVMVKEDDNGNARPTKAHENSPEKIDGISAALDAIAGWLFDMGEVEEEFESAYEERKTLLV
jgi:phage terminase large subunit-like protein